MGAQGNGAGYSIDNNGAGAGTVTDVALAAPVDVFNIAGSPVTTSGTLTLLFNTQVANRIWAGPVTGVPAVPTFRALVPLDIPALPYGTGTVTSVGLAAPSIFSVSGSPVTVSGTLTLSLANQSANQVFAGPVAGGAAAPAFRSLVVADIPTLPYASTAGLTTNIMTKMGAITLANSRLYDDGVLAGFGTTDNFQAMDPFNVRTPFAITRNANRGMMLTSEAGSGGYNSIQSYGGEPLVLNFIGNSVGIGKIPTSILDVNGLAKFTNMYGTSAAPGFTLGAAAGTGALLSATGTNMAGIITITIGSAPAGFGPLLSIVWAGAFAYPNNTILWLTPVSTAGQTLCNDHTITAVTTGATINTGVVAPLAGAIVQFQYASLGF